MYSASMQVYDQNGQPLAGIAIRMEVSTSSYFDVRLGATNANGFVYLSLTAPGIFEYMSVQIWGGDYVILSSQNTRTTTSNTLYPA